MSASGGRGQCLCGQVVYEVHGELRDVWLCHCSHCQRVTGNHMAAAQAAADDVTFIAAASLGWYSHQPGVRYGFCRSCGSSLFWQADDKADRLSICAGSLDRPTGLTTAAVLYRSEAADFHLAHPDVLTYAGDRPVEEPDRDA